MVDARAWGRARALGAVHEAERLGSPVVGTEHLLVATLADPTVRWAFRTVGVDLRELEDEVVRTTAERRPRPRTGTITPDAADAVMHAGGDSDALDADNPDDADVSVALRALARRFLSRTRHTDARFVLDGLGLIKHRTRVLATIEHNASRDHLRPPEERIVPPGSGNRRQSSRLRGLSAEHHPDPGAPAG